ncbi:39S Ribosomal Protein L9 [Manis pentadactyla]|nr:39S Ribosomal Protein L9 [Manis pentadactyla]
MDKQKEICSRQKTVSPSSAPPGSEGTDASGEPHLQVPWAPVTPTSTAWSDTAADNVQSSRVPFSKDNFMILPSASSLPCSSVTHPSQKQTPASCATPEVLLEAVGSGHGPPEASSPNALRASGILVRVFLLTPALGLGGLAFAYERSQVQKQTRLKGKSTTLVVQR